MTQQMTKKSPPQLFYDLVLDRIGARVAKWTNKNFMQRKDYLPDLWETFAMKFDSDFPVSKVDGL